MNDRYIDDLLFRHYEVWRTRLVWRVSLAGFIGFIAGLLLAVVVF